MVAAADTRRVGIYFLYRRIGTLEYQSDTLDDPWKVITGPSKMSYLTISHVTTRGPTSKLGKLPFSSVEITCDLGALLFSKYPPRTVWAVCVVPGVGEVFITGDERNQIQLQFVRDRAARKREYNLVFDLDETLIYNPHQMAGPVPGAAPVNPYPPHYINDPIDVPHMRPNVVPFLELVCAHFDQVRVCTMSIRQRANPIVSYLDPQHRTLLKNQRSTGRTLICREDMQAEGDNPWMASSIPATKSLELCNLPAGKEHRTIVLDDCWEIWPCRENLVAVMAPQEMGTISHHAYLNGDDGGLLGKHILMCLVNLALREERRADLMKVPTPVGLASEQTPQSPTIFSTYGGASRSWTSPVSDLLLSDYGSLKSSLRSPPTLMPMGHSAISPPPSRIALRDYPESIYNRSSYSSPWASSTLYQQDNRSAFRTTSPFIIRHY